MAIPGRSLHYIKLDVRFMSKIVRGNLFNKDSYHYNYSSEFFETIFTGNKCRLERIISSGHTSPAVGWYDQPEGEFVILLQGEATLFIENLGEVFLSSGDYLFIPPHCRHKVVATSTDPPCVWLAWHGDLKPGE